VEANLIWHRYFKLYEATGIIKSDSALKGGIFNDSNDPLEHGRIGAGDLPPTPEQVHDRCAPTAEVPTTSGTC
jgi:hypothetical protein